MYFNTLLGHSDFPTCVIPTKQVDCEASNSRVEGPRVSSAAYAASQTQCPSTSLGMTTFAQRLTFSTPPSSS